MTVLEKIKEDALSSNTQDQLDQMVKLRNRPRQRRTKLIKAGSGATAAIAVASNLIDISAPEAEGGQPIGLSVIGGVGTVIRGRVGFTATPGDIRIAGLWKLNDLLLSAAPSTIMTPIPVLNFSPPLDAVRQVAQNVATIAAMAGIL